ncbi:B12-binding domain-containing radical SAM protein [Candidatus Woesearchaeota archaeon]|nr:B12-binding domain-containing radical SAM protein [Candidatus Woesearchaeota archaeon]
MVKFLFLQDMAFEYLSPMQLSANLKKAGHDFELLIIPEEPKWINKMKDYNPDYILFSASAGHHNYILSLAREVRKYVNVPIILGGMYPTFDPDAAIKHEEVDMICMGEGDVALVEFADNSKRTNIKGMGFKKDGKVIMNDYARYVEDLDSLPFMDRSIYDKYKILQEIPAKKFMTGRGCPYPCTYCFNHHLKRIIGDKGKYARRRSAEHVIDEILDVKSKYNMKLVRFPDDTFTYNKPWLLDFLNKYKERVKLPFTCLGRPDELTEEVVIALEGAGCRNIFFGIESGNDYMRNEVMKRNTSKEKIINAGRLLKKYKIKFGTFNILGTPGETLEMAYETIKLNRQIGTDYPLASIFQPLSGTDMEDYAFRKGYLKRKLKPEEYMMFNAGSLMEGMDVRQLENLERFFYLACKFPFLDPLIKKMITLPPNRFFKLVFDLSSGKSLVGMMGLDLITSLKLGWKLRNKSFV